MEQLNVEADRIHEWLSERRKLDKYWAQQHKALKLKQEEIVKKIKKELDLEQVKGFFKKTQKEEKDLDYMELLGLRDVLVESEEGTKRNFFNQYSSQYIKELLALIKIFKNKFIHIASLAHDLNQKLNHELPAMKKVLKNNERLIKDFEFKISSFNSSVSYSRKEIVKLVLKYTPESEINDADVASLDLEIFLKNFVFGLVEKIQQIVNSVKAIDFPFLIECYKEFALFNNEEQFEVGYFQPLLDLFNKGHFLLEGEQKADFLELFLNSKGYYKKEQEEVIEIDWQIEDVDANDQQEQKKEKPKEKYDSNLTDRENREKSVQLIQELFYFLKIRLEETKKASIENDQQIFEFNKKLGSDKINEFFPKLSELLAFLNERQFNLILAILEDSRYFKKK